MPYLKVGAVLQHHKDASVHLLVAMANLFEDPPRYAVVEVGQYQRPEWFTQEELLGFSTVVIEDLKPLILAASKGE